jgi:hypothetical protein
MLRLFLPWNGANDSPSILYHETIEIVVGNQFRQKRIQGYSHFFHKIAPSLCLKSELEGVANSYPVPTARREAAPRYLSIDAYQVYSRHVPPPLHLTATPYYTLLSLSLQVACCSACLVQ